MKKHNSLKVVFFLGFLVLLIVFSSCSNSTNENRIPEKKDSLVINNKQLEKSVGLFKETSLPFMVDTTLLFKIENGDSLGGFEISTLAANCFKHDLTSRLENELKAFHYIDSLKEAGQYQQYCDSLDIGMIKYSTAHALNEVHLDANTLILIWGLHTSSYEACPYSTTWAVYFTIIYKGDVKETFLLGEYVAAGDAPVAMQRIVNGKMLADGTFTLNVTQINDEGDDVPEVELITEQYAFAIKDGAIKLVSEKKEKPQKVNRKKA